MSIAKSANTQTLTPGGTIVYTVVASNVGNTAVLPGLFNWPNNAEEGRNPGGLLFDRLFLMTVFGDVMRLTREGWRILTIRWVIFFVVLAVLNEVMWRFFSTDTWVTFKVFGIMPLTFVFESVTVPLLLKMPPPCAAELPITWL